VDRPAFARRTRAARWLVTGKYKLQGACLHRTHMDVKKKVWILV
jgi:hypothetical protein